MSERASESVSLRLLETERALAVVRAERIPDAGEPGHALAAGGIGALELTFTTPDVLRHVAWAAGAGVPVAEVAAAAGAPVFLGAFTPTEVADALDLGAAAVKTFPAGRLGPRRPPPSRRAPGEEITDRARAFAAALEEAP